MDQKTVLDYKKLEIRHKEAADEEISSLLGRTVLGTGKGLRYSVMDIRERMKFYGNGLSFIALYKRNNLAGAIGLCRRKTYSGDIEYSSVFLRYLAVRGSYQTSRVSERRNKKIAHIEDSFKQKIFSLFSDPSGLPVEMDDVTTKRIVYACVESENERSRNFVRQAGYEHIRSIATIAFSRFDPEMKAGVRKLNPEEEPAMASLLADHYRDHNFYCKEFSFIGHRYYTLTSDNEIVAGVNAIPTTFRLYNFPGIQGWIMMNLLPYLPGFKKIFKPDEFHFLVFDSVFCRQGHEKMLPELFESVCASENHNSAILWLDDRSVLYNKIRSGKKMGVLNRILKTKPGLLFASFSNIDDDEKGRFYKFPAYIAGIDLA
jgi:hypothetical protein